VADELELKAVVPDPDLVRARLSSAAGAAQLRGRMIDRRYDRRGELAARDEVLRVRTYQLDDGRIETLLGWKGPVRRSPEGYKQREEHEVGVAATPHPLLSALGYEVVHTVDREVEVYDVAGAIVRVEHYPEMDTLLEVEGTPDTIERAIRATGIDRAAFTAEPLAEFVRRFEARTGRPAVLARG
jgi:adenylate cyclase class IV